MLITQYYNSLDQLTASPSVFPPQQCTSAKEIKITRVAGNWIEWNGETTSLPNQTKPNHQVQPSVLRPIGIQLAKSIGRGSRCIFLAIPHQLEQQKRHLHSIAIIQFIKFASPSNATIKWHFGLVIDDWPINLWPQYEWHDFFFTSSGGGRKRERFLIIFTTWSPTTWSRLVCGRCGWFRSINDNESGGRIIRPWEVPFSRAGVLWPNHLFR